MSESALITQILADVQRGDSAAQGRLFDLAYDELRQLADKLMREERASHTLQATALVNEAAIRILQDADLENARTRALFYWTMSRAMRQVLVDHARRRNAQRRGGGKPAAAFQSADVLAGDKLAGDKGVDLVALNDLLDQLEHMDARQHRVVVLRFFGGFEMKEIAGQLEVSLSTVESDWRIARAWLRSKLN